MGRAGGTWPFIWTLTGRLRGIKIRRVKEEAICSSDVGEKDNLFEEANLIECTQLGSRRSMGNKAVHKKDVVMPSTW